MATKRKFLDIDLLDLLRLKIAKNGLRATARELKLSAPFVGDVANGNRGISETVGLRMGFEIISPPPPPPPPRIWGVSRPTGKENREK